ncbi:peptidoglycan DD-metalloendopeptidase family protein [Nocardioides sp. L-11A]|uniref:peptidoglycan DD-metalloendopeptidase family protein n=1 Tax=Nocardioides sp. L-11A TaxID=3043848 RepID=UPI00249B4F90|nr:M23 family metallopeptidase [Nocardioides sp. L-11A]
MTRSLLRPALLPVLLLLQLGLLLPIGPIGPVVPARAAPAGDPVGVWPLEPVPEVVRSFDPPDLPYGAGHRGVDLAGHAGQPVRAALPGVVVFAGPIAGRGVVVVGHGATRTTYEPVAATVGVGAALAAGATIGSLQSSGSHCLPRTCLHWGWIAGQTYLDPLRIVGTGPVRLLPLWRDEPVARAITRPIFATIATPFGANR